MLQLRPGRASRTVVAPLCSPRSSVLRDANRFPQSGRSRGIAGAEFDPDAVLSAHLATETSSVRDAEQADFPDEAGVRDWSGSSERVQTVAGARVPPARDRWSVSACRAGLPGPPACRRSPCSSPAMWPAGFLATACAPAREGRLQRRLVDKATPMHPSTAPSCKPGRERQRPPAYRPSTLAVRGRRRPADHRGLQGMVACAFTSASNPSILTAGVPPGPAADRIPPHAGWHEQLPGSTGLSDRRSSARRETSLTDAVRAPGSPRGLRRRDQRPAGDAGAASRDHGWDRLAAQARLLKRPTGRRHRRDS
jgi:hypothetical protein